MTRKLPAALAAAMICALPTAGLATDTSTMVLVQGTNRGETVAQVVSLAGLDVTSESDARRADSRLVKASKQVCGWVHGTILPETREYRTCVGNALTGARGNLQELIAARRQA